MEIKKPDYKRYMIFYYNFYESCGGMSDVVEDFCSKNKAIEYANSCKADSVEIFDRIKGITIDFKEKK